MGLRQGLQANRALGRAPILTGLLGATSALLLAGALHAGENAGREDGVPPVRAIAVALPADSNQLPRLLDFASRAGFNSVWLEGDALPGPEFRELCASVSSTGLRIIAEVRPMARDGFTFGSRAGAKLLEDRIAELGRIEGVGHVVLSFRGAPEVHFDLRDALRFGRNAASAHLGLALRLRRAAHGLDGFWLFPSDGTTEDPRGYAESLRTLLRESTPRLGLIWDGGGAPAREISVDEARRLREETSERPLMLFDAYPYDGTGEEDVTATPLGPLRGRPTRLRDELVGYVSRASLPGGTFRLPLLTISRWIRGPEYSPKEALGEALDALAGPDRSAREALAIQADEWGGWIGEPDHPRAADSTPEALAERLLDSAFTASLDWTVRRYPGRMQAVAKIADGTFRDDLLRVMERRYRIARCVPLCLEFAARTRAGREDAAAVLLRIEEERVSARGVSDDAASMLDRFLRAAGIPIGTEGLLRGDGDAPSGREELGGR